MGKDGIYFLAGMIFLGAAIGIPLAYLDNKQYEKLYNQAKIIADVNRDGVVAQQEWIDSYRNALIKHSEARYVEEYENAVKRISSKPKLDRSNIAILEEIIKNNNQ